MKHISVLFCPLYSRHHDDNSPHILLPFCFSFYYSLSPLYYREFYFYVCGICVAVTKTSSLWCCSQIIKFSQWQVLLGFITFEYFHTQLSTSIFSAVIKSRKSVGILRLFVILLRWNVGLDLILFFFFDSFLDETLNEDL